MTNDKTERALHHLAADQIAVGAQMIAMQHALASLVRMTADKTDDPTEFINEMISKAIPAQALYPSNGSSDKISRENYSAMLEGLHLICLNEPSAL